jgi:hypothetical protein
MSNITWIALFIVAVVVFVLNKRTNKKAAAIPRKTSSKTTNNASNVPDGQYLARYADEQADGEKRILIMLEITEGEFKGTKIPLIFEDAAAKRVLKEATGDFISRLASEGVGLASKLEDNIPDNGDHSFLLRTQDGRVVSVYKYNDEKINTFLNKLEKDPSFKG